MSRMGIVSWVARYGKRRSPELRSIRDPAVQRRLAATVPAVVVPAFDAVGLGIIRDLGRRGVPVVAIDSEPASLGFASRYAIPAVCRDPRYDEEGLLEDMERIGAALPQRAVLFPAFDDHVWVFSRHAERLSKYYILPFSRWEAMRRLADKQGQMNAARAAGIDTPQTYFVHGPGDLTAAAREVPFPALFKPLRPQEMRRRFGVKVMLAETPDQLAAVYEKAKECGPLMLQEIVPGEDDDLYTMGAYQDASAQPLGVFVGRKVRQHPPLFGDARMAESCWADDVADAGLRLLAELNYHGVSGTEFKRDSRDGRLKLMEVNARHWLYHPLATASGVDLSHLAYSDAVGNPVRAPRQTDGVRWLDFDRDARDSLLEVRRGQQSLGAWFSSFRNVRVDAIWALDDPVPALREWAAGSVRQVRREIAKLSGSMS
jgi:D-aspartate ligase